MNKAEYKICSKCVLDTTVRDISFDENGVCNYCRKYDIHAQKTVLRPPSELKSEFDKIISQIKIEGKNNMYDCILGLSGGVDSTYLAWLAKKENLRPLVVHFDNGWGKDVAVENIKKFMKQFFNRVIC